jgi:hypothetical protein
MSIMTLGGTLTCLTLTRPTCRWVRGPVPQGIATTGLDCIGRIVQLKMRARAIYGISIDDRGAARCPFEYNVGGEEKGRRKSRYALVAVGFAVTVPPRVHGPDLPHGLPGGAAGTERAQSVRRPPAAGP